MFNIAVINSPYIESRFEMVTQPELDAVKALDDALDIAFPINSQFGYLREHIRSHELELEKCDVFTDIVSYGDRNFIQYAFAEGTAEDWANASSIESVIRASLQAPAELELNTELSVFCDISKIKSFDDLKQELSYHSEMELEEPELENGYKAFMALRINRADGGGIFVICVLKD